MRAGEEVALLVKSDLAAATYARKSQLVHQAHIRSSHRDLSIQHKLVRSACSCDSH
jgi:hypothetical protein